jgi:hypothetical protein
VVAAAATMVSVRVMVCARKATVPALSRHPAAALFS